MQMQPAHFSKAAITRRKVGAILLLLFLTKTVIEGLRVVALNTQWDDTLNFYLLLQENQQVFTRSRRQRTGSGADVAQFF